MGEGCAREGPKTVIFEGKWLILMGRGRSENFRGNMKNCIIAAEKTTLICFDPFHATSIFLYPVKGSISTNELIRITHYLSNIYLFKFHNRDTRKMCVIYSKSTKTTNKTTSHFGIFF